MTAMTDDTVVLTATLTESGGSGGKDGFSPVVILNKDTAKGETTISITDATHTATAVIKDGKDGRDGTDGVSPTASVTQVDATTIRLTVTDASGTTTATLSGAAGEKGEKGDTGEKGEQGPAGAAGADGQPGKDGIDGHTPQKGVDYFTSADIAEIVAEIEADMDGSEVAY